MTEKELRKKVVDTAKKYHGCKEADGSHKKIINGYNSMKPLPRGYAVKYTDEWCATFVSFIAIKTGLTDIMPRECGCERMIELYKNLGRWKESDSYVPKAGDVIFYDWDDNGYGDNKGNSDHVGIVVSVSGNNIKVIEGNKGEAVAYRTIAVNGRYIRGYGIPNYASKATKEEVKKEETKKDANKNNTSVKKNALKYEVGDVVKFTGTKHYASSNGILAKSCKSGNAKVTIVAKGAKHPYHLVATKDGKSTVHGWVNESAISRKVSTGSTSSSTSTSKNANVDTAKSFKESIAKAYKTTSALNLRTGAGTDKKKLCVIPKGEKVECYGYYTRLDGVNWYLVKYKTYTGFVSNKYLVKA